VLFKQKLVMDYVAAIDIGTTNLKCQIFSNLEFRVVGSSIQKVCISLISQNFA